MERFPHTSDNFNKSNINICSMVIKFQQKRIFLRRCVEQNVLLPSNQRKGVDYDLLLTQQARRIKLSLNEIELTIKKYKDVWKKLSYEEKERLNQIKKSYKEEYINKFIWIQQKQYKNIIKFKFISKKKIKNRKDRIRYRQRKSERSKAIRKENINSNIINKSDYPIEDTHKNLLALGLNFAPTPYWNENVMDGEWLNLISHIRRVEWDDVLIDNNEQNTLPNKLIIPKFNRPDKNLINDKIHAYYNSVSGKLHNLESKVTHQYKKHNNLNHVQRNALLELRDLVKERKIVICKTDKDGKLVVVNYTDYNIVMNRELSSFTELSYPTNDDLKKHFKIIRIKFENLIIDLHKNEAIDNHFLKHIVGVKLYNDTYQRIPGPIAKNFVCDTPAYSYPLFKTHKLNPKLIETTSIFDIPVRLLQSAGNITTSRVTAFLEHILQPVSINYCKSEVNEYCRDSKQYLQELCLCKRTLNQNTDHIYIAAGDVKALYPSVPRNIIKQATTFALTKHSNYNQNTVDIIVNLIMLCLENVIVQHGNKFYKQTKGIVTGDNHSVSLANITLHYIISPISKILNQAIIFKRFIDDIIWISIGKKITNNIQTALKNVFENNDMELSFRITSTSEFGNSLEFLDVQHIIDDKQDCGFYTRDFLKPTSTDRLFLNGKSHHPPHVFKSIVFGECVRLRRLNELDHEYINSLNRLKEKCIRSKFNENSVNNIINQAKLWKERFGPKSNAQKKPKKLVWATPFTNIIKLNNREKQLVPEAVITYKRPKTLHNLLTNYSNIALSKISETTSGSSSPCHKCALCGNHGNSKSMVEPTSFITTNTGKVFKLKQSLTCKNYGIYAAQCNICKEIYVGQTKNRFSTRWTTHRCIWKNYTNPQNLEEKAALLSHYTDKHSIILHNKPNIESCFKVIFLHEPKNIKLLDFYESKWMQKLNSKINLNNSILPNFR